MLRSDVIFSTPGPLARVAPKARQASYSRFSGRGVALKAVASSRKLTATLDSGEFFFPGLVGTWWPLWLCVVRLFIRGVMIIGYEDLGK